MPYAIFKGGPLDGQRVAVQPNTYGIEAARIVDRRQAEVITPDTVKRRVGEDERVEVETIGYRPTKEVVDGATVFELTAWPRR